MRSASRLSASATSTRSIVTSRTVRGSCWFSRDCSSVAVKVSLSVPNMLQTRPAADKSPTSATTIQAILRFDMINLQMRAVPVNGSQGRGEPPDLGQDRVALVIRGARLGIIGRHQDRRAVGWPDHCDAVGCTIGPPAGFIADPPALRDSGAQPCAAGLVANEPGDDLLARGDR